MAKYGLPYMGSKDKIAENLICKLPKGKRFVDLFGGGFAMSHCALLSGRFEAVYYNEIDPLMTKLVEDSINGKYVNFVPDWVTKKDFEELKNSDGYIKTCWSFGNNGSDYLFGERKAEIKKWGHDWVVFGKYNENLKIPLYLRKYVNGEDIATRRLQLKRICKQEFNRIYKTIDKKEYEEYKKIMDIRDSHKESRETRLFFTSWLRSTGITSSEVNRLTNTKMASHYLCDKLEGQTAIPTKELWEKLKHSSKLKNIPQEIEDLFDDEKRAKRITEVTRKKFNLQHLQHLERLQHLEHLERLQHLQHLEHLEHLEINCGSYLDYEYKAGDIVYCDPPYEDTCGYNEDTFNHQQFYDWVANANYPVYFSSYRISDDRFKLIYCKLKNGNLCKEERGVKKTECLYWMVDNYGFWFWFWHFRWGNTSIKN